MLTLTVAMLGLVALVLLLDWQVRVHAVRALERGEAVSKLAPPRYRRDLTATSLK